MAGSNAGRPPEQSRQPQQEGYQLKIELSGEARVEPGSTLFVFLKAGESGPPAAVKRISNPSFPLSVTLGPGDTMISGTTLPSTGILFVRLDADGSASTKDATDLEAQVTAAINTRTTLVLKP